MYHDTKLCGESFPTLEAVMWELLATALLGDLMQTKAQWTITKCTWRSALFLNNSPHSKQLWQTGWRVFSFTWILKLAIYKIVHWYLSRLPSPWHQRVPDPPPAALERRWRAARWTGLAKRSNPEKKMLPFGHCPKVALTPPPCFGQLWSNFCLSRLRKKHTIKNFLKKT